MTFQFGLRLIQFIDKNVRDWILCEEKARKPNLEIYRHTQDPHKTERAPGETKYDGRTHEILRRYAYSSSRKSYEQPSAFKGDTS